MLKLNEQNFNILSDDKYLFPFHSFFPLFFPVCLYFVLVNTKILTSNCAGIFREVIITLRGWATCPPSKLFCPLFSWVGYCPHRKLVCPPSKLFPSFTNRVNYFAHKCRFHLHMKTLGHISSRIMRITHAYYIFQVIIKIFVITEDD